MPTDTASPAPARWQALRPQTVDQTIVETGMAGEIRSGDTAVSLPGWDAAFIDEDRAICERLQSSATSRWQPGELLDIERAVQRIIKETGISVLLVEQHLHFVRQSNFYYAMQRGGIVSSGPTSSLSVTVIQEFLTV